VVVLGGTSVTTTTGMLGIDVDGDVNIGGAIDANFDHERTILHNGFKWMRVAVLIGINCTTNINVAIYINSQHSRGCCYRSSTKNHHYF